MKNSNDTMGNRTRDLPTCSGVSLPTAPPRAPICNIRRIKSRNIIIQGVPGGKVNILGGHSIGHSKQKCLYEHVPYSERFPR